ncbi:DNA-directed RNA polymerase III, subunit Rpc31 [Podospora aff. communis PSN243]|uniref:DNA-directed RNA polymerase III subunit n=1 Tax=Podospora aff. communis PSN243 TaxID=3040156 RepID=A0AAV9GEB1_9PEZI|nr:DNA-directed RNA polymerase III, subunit Rpc31 [Podospora aff. communis PSN243]
MSGRGGRGGRGRGRGGGFGRGGRSVAANSVPWSADPDLAIDGKPSELFPPYNVPRALPRTRIEDRQVSSFLLFREQCHESPLYTQPRACNTSRSRGSRAYGQDQVNERYGRASKATVDPFTAVPSYSQRFLPPERTLPDLGSRPFAKEFFPPELHATLDGEDGPGAKRRKAGPKTLGLSNITSLRTAAEVFFADREHHVGGDIDKDLNEAMRLIDSMEKRGEEGEDDEFLLDDEEEWVREQGDEEGENMDDPDQYDDEDDNDDYNAENYFDTGEDNEDEDGGGNDGGDYM